VGLEGEPDSLEGMLGKMERHKIFTDPLSTGVYFFDKNGFLRKAFESAFYS
jgi:hypothetical protein